jgi:hypothetical protein
MTPTAGPDTPTPTEQPPTETEEPEPTETEEPEPTATEEPEPTATPEPTEPLFVSEEDAEAFDQLRQAALGAGSIFGPVDGSLPEGVGTVQGIFPGVAVADFYLSAVFTNPSDVSNPFDYGFGFRHTQGNNQLRLILSSAGEWLLTFGDSPPIPSGSTFVFNSEAGGQNTVELVAQGGTGYLAVNGVVVAVIDIAQWQNAGDIWVAAGLSAPDIVSGRTSFVSQYQIWPL